MIRKAVRAAAAAYTSDTAFHFGLLLAFGLPGQWERNGIAAAGSPAYPKPSTIAWAHISVLVRTPGEIAMYTGAVEPPLLAVCMRLIT